MNRILVIDDDIELCELLTDYLSGEGFSVEMVNDGKQGVVQALAAEYILVILDVMLPEMNGFMSSAKSVNPVRFRSLC